MIWIGTINSSGRMSKVDNTVHMIRLLSQLRSAAMQRTKYNPPA
jgi:hypothetical protein